MMSENGIQYDSDYYERGMATGKSCYENYRWIPELTIPMAMALVDYLGLDRTHTILDFGCAKGFLVKALRMLNRQAWGVDVSQYAIDNSDSEIKKYCAITKPDFSLAYPYNGNKMPAMFDYCISKDVFEHIPEEMLRKIVTKMPATIMFVVVPLGNGKKYNIPSFHLDKTHIHKQPLDWWQELFDDCGWSTVEACFRIKGIKDNWANIQKGHGFFILKNKGLGYL
jgi:2-polyprenyl-3-methyl-5-hydroxy-6-metoxy-1,4-benzoquinol methylase